jgi:hypothetical protein
MAKKTNAKSPLGIKASRRAASDFLRAGRRNELAKEGGFDLHNRFRDMSDEDFDRAVGDGSITQDQIRKAGEYAYNNYLDDVWSETDRAETEAEPTYEEFMANPAKYGYSERPDDEMPDRFYRYNPARYANKPAPAASAPAKVTAPAIPEGGPAPADNTAVARKPLK